MEWGEIRLDESGGWVRVGSGGRVSLRWLGRGELALVGVG